MDFRCWSSWLLGGLSVRAGREKHGVDGAPPVRRIVEGHLTEGSPVAMISSKAGRRGAAPAPGLQGTWSRCPGLNRGPTVYETVALPLSYSGKVGANWYPRQVNHASGEAGKRRAPAGQGRSVDQRAGGTAIRPGRRGSGAVHLVAPVTMASGARRGLGATAAMRAPRCEDCGGRDHGYSGCSRAPGSARPRARNCVAGRAMGCGRSGSCSARIGRAR